MNPVVVAPGVGLGLEWPFAGRFAARGSGQLSTIVTKTALVVDEAQMWRTPHVAGSFAIGLTAAF